MPREQFRLPDLGEGLPDAEIVRWLVAVGEPVTINQPIVEVETAKALVEVPSPLTGVLVVRHAEPGDTVEVGRPLITVDTDATAAAASLGPATRPERGTDSPADGRTPVLVGYGPRTSAGPSRTRPRQRTDENGQNRQKERNKPDGPAIRPEHAEHAERRSQPGVLAKPPVRKLARDLGIDLWRIAGTGPHGTISRADVEAARLPAREEPASRVRRIPVTGVRRATAAAMVASAYTAPQVTEFVSVDVTEMMAARDRIAALPEFTGVKVTALLFVAQALLTAVQRHPMINSSWAEAAGDAPAQILIHEDVNLGIAVASPRGLVVPNIPRAQGMGLVALGHALHELTTTARAGKITPGSLRGGTITITNIGVFGIDIGTPILNPPEAAILALGAIRPTPWIHNGELAVRTVAQLALTFDHRIVDGELAARVLADVGAMLADPAVALAWSARQ
ncbi:dihydrolipoamide acetyltransferase family protein [Frankia sp. CiP3]|uniref:dihydrolipoamide acetyltransferase family protein n=1 Tax=Frankia sp. CiP3 TaxID=2880971 RepID=UPI001EF4A670|nr:dihydrolipoamide acetyltransferase family protein [Frankia sp. CiP3]